MSKSSHKILIIDDDPTLITILSDFLEMEGYQPIPANEGETGLKLLEENQDVSAIILDWVLPSITGIQLLKKIKQKEAYLDIPVIMQTGKKDKESVIEGIEAGAFYYMTKPYSLKVLITILKKAIFDYENLRLVKESLQVNKCSITDFLKKGEIELKAPGEALRVASFFTQYTDYDKASIGLSELLLNAIEHGNLGIGYDMKEELIMDDRFDEEIRNRLNAPENIDKTVKVIFEKTSDSIKISISDRGSGFDYNNFLRLDPDTIFNVHGRGVAMAKLIFENRLEFSGNGNTVEIILPLREQEVKKNDKP
ncbi:response regulator [Spirochaeta isovalerica]|uniref:DNA-binding response OmpR family regulator n=1 Tax=Spirochaeta isovalerica TaxID=150 RepID=A0A841R882_9SPIO|nr:response regulator [Spirochaeta isovalerica]MBB6480026.1 DNA-binding response OmpR family regulator [Spirochaeta isovalerica]